MGARHGFRGCGEPIGARAHGAGHHAHHRADARDRGRSVSPLRAADDAVVVDTTSMALDAVVERVLEVLRTAFPEVKG